jgi:hypothetical protein
MKAQLDWQTYRNLEFETQKNNQQNHQKKSRTVRTGFHGFWQTVLAQLAPTSEPRVWQTQDETGQTVWSAYDPISGKSIHQVSADRVRAWLRL